MTLEEFIKEKEKRLQEKLASFKEDIQGRYPDEMPRPFPSTYKEWKRAIKMEKNTKCQINSDHHHHANRIGYFQFYGEGKSADTAVFSANPVQPTNGWQSISYFAVGKKDFKKV